MNRGLTMEQGTGQAGPAQFRAGPKGRNPGWAFLQSRPCYDVKCADKSASGRGPSLGRKSPTWACSIRLHLPNRLAPNPSPGGALSVVRSHGLREKARLAPIDRGRAAPDGRTTLKQSEDSVAPHKIAIVGIGKISQDQHLPVIAKDPDFSSSVWSASEASARRVCRRFRLLRRCSLRFPTLTPWRSARRPDRATPSRARRSMQASMCCWKSRPPPPRRNWRISPPMPGTGKGCSSRRGIPSTMPLSKPRAGP